MHVVRGRPQVVAHRGASHAAAEHTLGAYLAALDEGAEALECDVRLTADGHLVCVHDRRVDRTADGRGVVSTMNLVQLDELDFAAWKRPWAELDDEAPMVDEATRKVLTMKGLLEAVADYDRPIDVAIETKHPTRYGGLVERRLIELLETFGWAGKHSPVRVMSFSWVALNRVKRLAPDLEVVQLVERLVAWPKTENIITRGWIAGPGIDLLRENPRFARKLGASRRRVHVWVVNTAEDLDLCQELGVEAVISDNPGFALRHLTGSSPGRTSGGGAPAAGE